MKFPLQYSTPKYFTADSIGSESEKVDVENETSSEISNKTRKMSRRDVALQYIENNREYFTGVMENAPNIPSGILGLGNKRMKGMFSAILYEKDTYFLPFCLYLIHNGTPREIDGEIIENNESFASEGLKFLHQNSAGDLASYYYAYSLRFNNQFDDCVGILYELADREFSPALMTLAEMKLYYKKPDEALMFYERAKAQKHILAAGRIRFLNKKRGWLVLHWVFYIPRFMRLFWQNSITRQRGERFILPDFHFFKERMKPIMLGIPKD